MPQMRQPQESTRFRQFLLQDIEEELAKRLKGLFHPPCRGLPLRHSARGAALSAGLILVLCACALAFPSCAHQPEALVSDSPDSGPATNVRIFDLDEKVILKGIARVCKNRGYPEVNVVSDQNRVETGYLVEEDWRTKIVASVKKVSRRDREVTLSVYTERKSSSEWEPKKVMGKQQYDKLFNDIELQVYRELYKAE